MIAFGLFYSREDSDDEEFATVFPKSNAGDSYYKKESIKERFLGKEIDVETTIDAYYKNIDHPDNYIVLYGDFSNRINKQIYFSYPAFMMCMENPDLFIIQEYQEYFDEAPCSILLLQDRISSKRNASFAWGVLAFSRRSEKV